MSIATMPEARHAAPTILRKPDVRLRSALRLWQRNYSRFVRKSVHVSS